MKTLNTYINEWKLNDQTSKNVDRNNINKLISKINELSKNKTNGSFKNGFGLGLDGDYLGDFSLNYIMNIMKNISIKIKIKDEYEFDSLKDENILLLHWGNTFGYYESIEVSLKIKSLNEPKYFVILFYIDYTNTMYISCSIRGDNRYTGVLEESYKIINKSELIKLIECIKDNEKNVYEGMPYEDIKKIINELK